MNRNVEICFSFLYSQQNIIRKIWGYNGVFNYFIYICDSNLKSMRILTDSLDITLLNVRISVENITD